MRRPGRNISKTKNSMDTSTKHSSYRKRPFFSPKTKSLHEDISLTAKSVELPWVRWEGSWIAVIILTSLREEFLLKLGKWLWSTSTSGKGLKFCSKCANGTISDCLSAPSLFSWQNTSRISGREKKLSWFWKDRLDEGWVSLKFTPLICRWSSDSRLESWMKIWYRKCWTIRNVFLVKIDTNFLLTLLNFSSKETTLDINTTSSRPFWRLRNTVLQVLAATKF